MECPHYRLIKSKSAKRCIRSEGRRQKDNTHGSDGCNIRDIYSASCAELQSHAFVDGLERLSFLTTSAKLRPCKALSTLHICSNGHTKGDWQHLAVASLHNIVCHFDWFRQMLLLTRDQKQAHSSHNCACHQSTSILWNFRRQRTTAIFQCCKH